MSMSVYAPPVSAAVALNVGVSPAIRQRSPSAAPRTRATAAVSFRSRVIAGSLL
jgi:hypothetical protein